MPRYAAPDQEQVRAALRRIPTAQLRRAFFEGLNNPLWVEPLAKEQAFRNPADPQPTEDGLVVDVYWPEIGYLTRVAPEAPREVVDVLLSLASSQNAWVRRGAFTIGTSIPPAQAARLVPLFSSWARTGFGWRTDPRDMVSCAVNLLTGGEHAAGKKLATLLFKPGASVSRRTPGFALEDYWYEELLPRVSAALGDDGLQTLLPWLEELQKKKGHLKRGYDVTYWARDAIRTRGDSHPSVEHALIDATRDAAITGMLCDPTATKARLLSSGMILGRKLALFALAEALRLSTDPSLRQEMIDEARELMVDLDSLDESCRIDYGELARATAKAAGGPLDFLADLLSRGNPADEQYLRDRLGRDGADPNEVDERLAGYQERWTHRWLSAVGFEALPEFLRSRLAELDSSLGAIENPLAPESRVGQWVGPSSPMSQDEMSALTPAELVAHLESWHVPAIGVGLIPSHEGQARELQSLVTSNPMAVVGPDRLSERLRPTYLRAILSGWQAAQKAGLELDWEATVDLVADVLAHEVHSTFAVEGNGFEDDPDYREAKRAATSLVVEVTKLRADPALPASVLQSFAKLLLDPTLHETVAQASGQGEDTWTDALTASHNERSAMRVRGLINLIAHGTATPWFDAARRALEDSFSGDDPKGAGRAVLGEGVAYLLDVDRGWVDSQAATWFGGRSGSSPAQQIALTTAIGVHRYHPTFYQLLAAPMAAAIDSGGPIEAGWRAQTNPLQKIGEWIVIAVIRGDDSLLGPTPSVFFSKAPAKTRGEAIGHIAWEFMHSEGLDDELRDRLGELWDARVAHVRQHPEDHEELSGFFWFVRSGKFAVDWWLPRLLQALELAPSLAGERYMIGKELASASDSDPRTALSVLKLLLVDRKKAGFAGFDLGENALPMVIARALRAGDEQLAADARGYLNQLGEHGYLTLDKEVEAVLNGTITQDDVHD